MTQTEPQTESAPLDFATEYVAGYLSVVTYLRHCMQTGQRVSRNHERSLEGLSPDDLAQDAWLRAWAHWPELARRSRSRLRAWVFTAAHRLLIDRLRRYELERRVGGLPMTDDLWQFAQMSIADEQPDTQPEQLLLTRERFAEVSAQIEQVITSGRLKHPERVLAHLHARLIGEPDEVVAARLGVSTHLIKGERWRLRQLLHAEQQRQDYLQEQHSA